MTVKKEVYRQAASVLLLRPSAVCSSEGRGKHYEVLLLHKPRKRDAWQLPQGGVEEGEDIEKAALRELQEEAGIAQVTVVGRSREVYQYDFPASYRRFRPDHVRGQRIAYVFAVAMGDVPVTVDQQEIDGFVWVSLEQLPHYIRRRAYEDLVRRLVQEAQQYFPHVTPQS
ncbi:NUDIX domain-containing protein [Candidatus Peregrinibacteria bacterium]|nr:NUDIX domain-containing protein [Candidatus Peregrinibacteria bacterium]